MKSRQPSFQIALLPLILLNGFAYAEHANDGSAGLENIYVTAERQLQQSLGVSKISADDIEKRPVVNDISEIIRTMPGVNLTGNTASGERGNNRQIDIRGMGPENTLILIDGRPVMSRNAERYSWRGERNTRGDSNWVPVEDIESIEVIRGPAAARYGSGAAGGVVNIITKKVSTKFSAGLDYFTNQPFSKDEGATNRVGFHLSGPLVKDVLSFRIYGNLNKTGADAPDINRHASNNADNQAAGREGVRNKDIAGRLVWRITPEQTLSFDHGFSRQGNIYTGDTQNNSPSPLTQELAGQGAETSRLYRQSHALSHDGSWDWGETKIGIAYDRTTNSRYPEGLAGGGEGAYNDNVYVDSVLKNWRLNAEASIPFTLGGSHVLTVGVEGGRSTLNDPSSMSQKMGFGNIPGLANTRSGKSSQSNWAMFVEDNYEVRTGTRLIPTIRLDYHNKSGFNVSPGFNFSQSIGEYWTIKGGIARSYKTPNLYQNNPNYLLATRGNGCPVSVTHGSCYLMGNDHLKPENSINKEIGFEYSHNGYLASMAWFRNDYKNKIVAGDEIFALSSNGANVLRWENAGKAVVEGLEGNLTLPFGSRLKWTNNFTYMHQSVNKDTGNPLSIIPKYTINSGLNWQPTEKWDIALTFTHYGKQKPRRFAISRIDQDRLSNQSLGSYSLWGIATGYRFGKHVHLRAGVNNLFNKRLWRNANNSSAQSYNEAGRAVYGSLKVSF